jgi:hypothetical protein
MARLDDVLEALTMAFRPALYLLVALVTIWSARYSVWMDCRRANSARCCSRMA